MKTAQSPAGSRERALSSELARFCLRQDFRDESRMLAWVNSICLLFLLVGILGLKSPRVPSRPTSGAADIVPVLLIPTAEQQSARQLDAPKASTPLEDLRIEPLDQPVVATAVAAADITAAFPVPITRTMPVMPARFAAAGLATNVISVLPTSSQLILSEADWGGHPQPEYPLLAKRRGYQGKVALEILFAPSGGVSSVQVKESSGYKILDDTALGHVRRHLRLRRPTGETRLHTLDVFFQLKP